VFETKQNDLKHFFTKTFKNSEAPSKEAKPYLSIYKKALLLVKKKVKTQK